MKNTSQTTRKVTPKNPVLPTTKEITSNPKYVTIDTQKIDILAEKYAQEELPLPNWDAPVFLPDTNFDTIDFFFAANSINFLFTDFETKEKYTTTYQEKEWKGAYGMWAAMKKAFENDKPITDGHYLKNLTVQAAEQIFEGNMRMPLLEERVKILNEVGKKLSDSYDGRFHQFLMNAGKKLYNEGNGVVERLVKEFPSFDDSTKIGENIARFDKRAQLLVSMIYSRFYNTLGWELFEDIGELTVFADYVLPKTLRDLSILHYQNSLAERVDSGGLILANSQEELEIRASTLHASDYLLKGINKTRIKEGTYPITAMHLDNKLWTESRGKKGNHHFTKTTAY